MPTKKPPTPWYADGLRFKCTGCGDCCTGAPGYVWVNKADIELIAAELDMDVPDFEKKYVRNVGVRKSLVEFSNGDCVFFDGKTRKCEVYAARPRQCRTWPFWDSNIRSPEAWQATCDECPGAGKGKLYDIDHIEAERAKIRV
ncbi:YkgJ family cysteine cluster protein [Aeoliella sp. ICT_H6.2]|uniref:YkgJ family cysteine cluster protein n=1 Tax=Aeoliella straminimaris TaxID=2954799 RepID=A0A9X2FAJ5_9BACT|nr:YkgJ family cysteine cluster protein [Aeoliella straminimaris]MCO6044572.1 YkgJ family cysteine cluster protein [Aeoliella straminimaris]